MYTARGLQFKKAALERKTPRDRQNSQGGVFIREKGTEKKREGEGETDLRTGTAEEKRVAESQR